MAKQRTPGEILKEARLKQGFTQAKVAKMAGLHANTYAKIERGDNQPSPESIKKLVKVLPISRDNLLLLLG